MLNLNMRSHRVGLQTLTTAVILCILCVCVTEVTSKSGFKHMLIGDKPRQKLCYYTFNLTTTNSSANASTTTTTPPPNNLTYTCPRPNEYEKKTYCCSNNKCCDKKDFEWEQQHQLRQATADFLSKADVGGILKTVLIVILIIVVVVLVLVCLCVKTLCKTGKQLSGLVLGTRPSNTQTMSPYPTAASTTGFAQPGYVPVNSQAGYPHWQPQTPVNNSAPTYPPYQPTSYPAAAPPAPGFQQPPFNPNYG